MLNNPKTKRKGFLGAVKTAARKHPYKQTERSSSMYPLGNESNFIIPPSEEARRNSPRGMKR